MKAKAMIIVSLLFTLTAGAQTVNIHLKSGEVVKYDSSVFDYIDFSATGPEIPVTYTGCPDSNHPHMIDLGLPSGTKWACCNVGSSAPEQYGNYYAWGETSPKSVYNWSTYRWGSNYYELTKYCTKDSYGTVDNKTELDASDDAATANWGAPWRMPSRTQIQELLNSCTSTWTSQNGVNGRKFVGPNGGTIFLPAAGGRLIDWLYGAGSHGYFWSSPLVESDPGHAYFLHFDSGDAYWDYGYRAHGHTVRPVREN